MILAAHGERCLWCDLLAGFRYRAVAAEDFAGKDQGLGTRSAFGQPAFDQSLIGALALHGRGGCQRAAGPVEVLVCIARFGGGGMTNIGTSPNMGEIGRCATDALMTDARSAEEAALRWGETVSRVSRFPVHETADRGVGFALGKPRVPRTQADGLRGEVMGVRLLVTDGEFSLHGNDARGLAGVSFRCA
jgi:hypothetical protein